MKAFVLEFSHFDKVAWEKRAVKITALSKTQLMRGFISEFFHDKVEAKQIWKENSKYIYEITFPIIESISLK
jgi:hypothetical protein